VWISIATALAVIVTGTGVTALIIRHNINAKINYVEVAFPVLPDLPSPSIEPSEDAPPEPVNFLVLGSDSLSSGGDPTDWQAGGQRSDVMMLAQISGDRQSVNVMSIPRDSWVPIEGHGEAKINAAFSYGGAELAISTVQDLTGVTIDHFAIVDFVSFEKLTDQLGGVTIPTAAGDRKMNGEEALAFVRNRHSLPRGDFDRVRRQQAWIKSILSAVFDKDVLKSPTQVASLINIVLDYSAVDQGIDFDYMAGLALEVKDLRPAGVQFLTAPYTGTGRSPDGKQSIVVLDRAKLNPLMEAWRDDGLAAYIEANPDAVPRLEDRPVS
jgi:LCP family protein required for cell wall assembly